nr:hypothetical protein [Burkholderia sp. BCC1208]
MSVTNSFLFSNSRVLSSLSHRGHAPAMFGRANAKGVPMNALVLCLTICVSILGMHFASGGDLFLLLAKSSGAGARSVQPNGRTPISGPCRNSANTAQATSPAATAATSPASPPAG